MKHSTKITSHGVKTKDKYDYSLKIYTLDKPNINQEVLPRKKNLPLETRRIQTQMQAGILGIFMIVLGFLILISLLASFLLLLFVPDHLTPELNLDQNIKEYLAFEENVIRKSILQENITRSENSLFQSLSFKEYKVKKGDSLSKIASKNKLSIGTIISVNKINSVGRIHIGKKLRLPNTDGLRYVVRKGDSLSKIASRHKIAINNLLDWNEISSSIINIGQVLFLPGAKLSKWRINQVLGRLFIYPAKGRLSDKFGWRKHPITGAPHYHKGIDIANRLGTLIKASNAGKVRDVGYNRSYGNYIIIAHEQGFKTLYGHLRKTYVKRGQWVDQGQKIGEMGSTGVSTGSHLHFGIDKNGSYIDPLMYLK